MSRTALGSNQHPNQRSPGFINWNTAARSEDDQLHRMSRLRMNGDITRLSDIFRDVNLGNFTRPEITRQHGTIIKEKEISTQKPPRKGYMWVQCRIGWISQPANSQHINSTREDIKIHKSRSPNIGSCSSFYLIFRFVNSKWRHSITNIRQGKVWHCEGKLKQRNSPITFK
jgi:hypothetical protein